MYRVLQDHSRSSRLESLRSKRGSSIQTFPRVPFLQPLTLSFFSELPGCDLRTRGLTDPRIVRGLQRDPPSLVSAQQQEGEDWEGSRGTRGRIVAYGGEGFARTDDGDLIFHDVSGFVAISQKQGDGRGN